MKIFVNEEIEDVIRKHCKENKIRKDFAWHYLYVVSNIFMRPYMDKSVQDFDYVLINIKILRELISHTKASTIMDDLLKLNILETDGIIIIGEKSKGYKIINRCCLTWKLKEIEDYELVKKLTGKYDIIKDNVNKYGRGYQIVNYWFNLLEIDVKKAKKSMSNRYNRTDMNRNQYDSAICSINLFGNEMKFITVDDTSNRLHCNLTNIDAKLRKFLTINGERLAQVDISNSQPLFLGMVMKDNAMIDPVELDKYIRLVCTGKFYIFLAAKMSGESLDLDDPDVKKAFKKSIFSGVLFDRNRKKLSKYEELFQKEFPAIFAEVRRMKAKNYKAIAIML